MRRKKERSKQCQTNKQGKATQHTQGSHYMYTCTAMHNNQKIKVTIYVNSAIKYTPQYKTTIYTLCTYTSIDVYNHIRDMYVHNNKRNNQNKQKSQSQYFYQNPHINYMYMYVHTHFRSTRTMSKPPVTIENFLQHQTEEYQRHYLTKQRIARALEHQKNIRLFRTIPKHYLPAKTPELPVDDPSLSAEFYRNYETLFFQHLDKTIIHNTITLELEDARLRQAVLNTEQQLAAITEPPTTIAHHQKCACMCACV